MIFKKREKEGLEGLSSLISTRLKEVDPIETEDDVSTITSVEIPLGLETPVAQMAPEESLVQAYSEDSESCLSFDRYNMHNVNKIESAEDESDLPSDRYHINSMDSADEFNDSANDTYNMDLTDSADEANDLANVSVEDAGNHSLNAGILPRMIKRVSFSEEANHVLEFEKDESASSVSTPKDLKVIGNRDGGDAEIFPEKVADPPLGIPTSSPSLADSFETLSVEKSVSNCTTTHGGVKTTDSSTKMVPVVKSCLEQPDISPDEKNIDSGSTNEASSSTYVAASSEHTSPPKDDGEDDVKLEVAQFKNIPESNDALKGRTSVMKRDSESAKTKSSRGRMLSRVLGLRKNVKKNTTTTQKPTTATGVFITPKPSTIQEVAITHPENSPITEPGSNSFLDLSKPNAPKPSTTQREAGTHSDNTPITEPDSDLCYNLSKVVAASSAAAVATTSFVAITAASAAASVAAAGKSIFLTLPSCCPEGVPSYENKNTPREVEEYESMHTEGTLVEHPSVTPMEHPSPTKTRRGEVQVRQKSTVPRNYSKSKGGNEESFFAGSVRMFMFSHSSNPSTVFSNSLFEFNAPSRILVTKISMMTYCQEQSRRSHPSSVLQLAEARISSHPSLADPFLAVR